MFLFHDSPLGIPIWGQTLDMFPVARGLQFLLNDTCAPEWYSPSCQFKAWQPSRIARLVVPAQAFYSEPSIYPPLVATTAIAWSHVPLTSLSLDRGSLPLKAEKLAAFGLVQLAPIRQFAAALFPSHLPYLICRLLLVGRPLKTTVVWIPQLLAHPLHRWPGIPKLLAWFWGVFQG